MSDLKKIIIDGREIGQVAVVGKIMSVEKPSASGGAGGLSMDDGTDAAGDVGDAGPPSGWPSE